MIKSARLRKIIIQSNQQHQNKLNLIAGKLSKLSMSGNQGCYSHVFADKRRVPSDLVSNAVTRVRPSCFYVNPFCIHGA